jgi:hypothetical protein
MYALKKALTTPGVKGGGLLATGRLAVDRGIMPHEEISVSE